MSLLGNNGPLFIRALYNSVSANLELSMWPEATETDLKTLSLVQALQESAPASPVQGPEGGAEVHHRHHRGPTQKLPSLVSVGGCQIHVI